jgi:hypothetical protein
LSEDQLHDLQLECDFYQLDGLKELITAATKDEGVFLGKSRYNVPMEYTSVTFFQPCYPQSGCPRVRLEEVNALGMQMWQVHSVVGSTADQEFLMSRAL